MKYGKRYVNHYKEKYTVLLITSLSHQFTWFCINQAIKLNSSIHFLCYITNNISIGNNN